MVAPSGEGAVRCMRMAMAGLDGKGVGKVGYINPHGTGTPVGDQREIEAIREVFGKDIPPISATKSLTGHSLGAVGVQEAIFSLLMMNNGFICESANIEELDPEFADMPIVRSRQDNADLNCVMSNSFGFGGTNATLVLKRCEAWRFNPRRSTVRGHGTAQRHFRSPELVETTEALSWARAAHAQHDWKKAMTEKDFAKPGPLMAGKRGLIMGVANERSIAWGIARILAGQGAELAFTYQGDAFGRRAIPLAKSVGVRDHRSAATSPTSRPSTLPSPRSRRRGARLDFVVHALAFSDQRELSGRYSRHDARELHQHHGDLLLLLHRGRQARRAA